MSMLIAHPPSATSSASTALQDRIDTDLGKNYEEYDRRITFKKAVWACSTSIENTSYKPLNIIEKHGYRDEIKSENVPKVNKSEEGLATASSKPVDPLLGEQLAEPARVLYPPAKVNQTMRWRSVQKAGCGLGNNSNTCFLNSVLQCLTHTPPLANYLMSGEHVRNCRSQRTACAMCEMEAHVKIAFTTKHSSVYPKKIVNNLKVWAKHFRKGRQEDAHEFLRLFVDAMQDSCLDGFDKKMDSKIKATTLIHQVFGGYTRSQVKCATCHYQSNTYEESLELSLDIKNARSLTKSLAKFTQKEVLEKDNQYKCVRCNKKVNAVKRMTVHRAPKVLSVHLKRFDWQGGKVRGHVPFSEYLDLFPYMSETFDDEKSTDEKTVYKYQLMSVMVHAGYSTRSGHYYCFVKAANGVWYEMDDEVARKVSLKTVLQQDAYMLFYVRVGDERDGTKKAGESVASASNEEMVDKQDSVNRKISLDADMHVAFRKSEANSVELSLAALVSSNQDSVSSSSNPTDSRRSFDISGARSVDYIAKKAKRRQLKAERKKARRAAASGGLISASPVVEVIVDSKAGSFADTFAASLIASASTDMTLAYDSNVAAGVKNGTGSDTVHDTGNISDLDNVEHIRKGESSGKKHKLVNGWHVDKVNGGTPAKAHESKFQKSELTPVSRKRTGPAALLHAIPSSNKRPKNVVVKEWDGDLKDDLALVAKPKKTKRDNGLVFDGHRNIAKENELNRVINRKNTSEGFGGQITTWANEKKASAVDTIRDRREFMSEHISSYTVDDTEIDQGRTKKVKGPKQNNVFSNHKNHFQLHQQKKAANAKKPEKRFKLKPSSLEG
ncbi:hypothetical protein SARC_04092 [Sphaeroforma arctica JP610]|uniref:ubiquitinyl hydrolase 1 n=1 Tax=Sphaeroforma arctica JP610 TaxID=667725 RepID=A0A0L0G468_9EUKA|nr:hypothetical protein SARC_04092 [Sphaeroforma arctica JP610]KNC83659.1 hypothetical protein SARC_04092 [Sphaeroforma arctica JP610]|eukprot:XP_014157561.1 hypothetical protein SARC_04092 [Sphaeroforma arctica JP610]